ncbi:MAG: hypothetical protein ACHBN1_02010 [Heteroscytonema crispum UTEX LB 1556]
MPNTQGTPDAWVGKPSRSTGATMPNAQYPFRATYHTFDVRLIKWKSFS